LVISVWAFLRTLFQDQVVADLVFEWDATLGVAVGKIVIENPLRHSIYLWGIRFDEPARGDVVVRMPGSGLYDVLSDAYQEAVSADNRIAITNARIPPKGDLEIELEFKGESTDLCLRFEWSKAMPWTVKRSPRLTHAASNTRQATSRL
jgi:hypothetical protein